MIYRLHLTALILILQSVSLCAQVISAKGSLAVTNAVEIGRVDARAKLKAASPSINKHLLFNIKSGTFKGVIIDKDAESMYLFDSTGLLDLILKPHGDDIVNVFDMQGRWLYVVKNRKHLFNATGNMQAVLSTRDGKVFMTRINSAKKKKPKKEEPAEQTTEQE